MRLGEYPPTSLPPDEAEARIFPFHAAGDPELAALTALGFSKPTLLAAAGRARQNGTSIESELLHGGEVSEAAYYGAIARFLRLPFIDTIDPALVTDTATLDTQLHRPNQIRFHPRQQAPRTAIVPEAARLADVATALATWPSLGRDLLITTPSAIRGAVWKAGRERRVHETVDRLFDRFPEFSARVVLTGNQGFWAGTIAMALVSAMIVAPFETLSHLHVTLSLVYLIALFLRIAALAGKKLGRARPQPLPSSNEPLPRYTVMVALYREADVAGQLVASLKRLDWPHSLLDVKLVCEADDHETIAALTALALPAHFEIVEVPPAQPRTKPKALTYALAAARGELLAIYDAEDRPHPEQLREAHARFRAGPPELACLQAPLIITNARDGWISALFSLEYSGLFRGLLPMLARAGMPLPLGGTSNHFKTSILREAGGWDPFNVTEDADLGLRLYRLGYRSDVIHRQTLEDAPTTKRVWMNQRSRWFKGWLQTWLVLMRSPRRLIREMGLLAFCIFQLLVGGMLISSLLHPLIIAFVGFGTWSMMAAPAADIPVGTLSLLIIDGFNIVASYLVFLSLGVGSMIDHEKRLIGRSWAYVPVYWLMTSAAAWRAVFELRSKPFFWNKTPHRPSGVRKAQE